MATQIIDWTPENVETLRTMWAAGRTFTEIANALGAPKGRNAVIGKANRLKVQKRSMGRPRQSTAEKMEKARQATAATRQRKAEALERAKLIPKLPKRETTSDGNPRPPDKRFLDRKEAWMPLPDSAPVPRDQDAPGCQWPVDVEGSTMIHFCNLPRKSKADAGNHPYCETHYHLRTRRL